MSGDYTRSTFRPERRYATVRLQQGRVQLDADWNEAEDIALARDRTTARDVVGANGVPAGSAGFALAPVGNVDATGAGDDLLVGFGRAYVGGVLVEHGAPPSTELEPVAGDAGHFHVTAGPVPTLGQTLVGAGGAARRVTEVPTPVAADDGRVRLVLEPAPPAAAFTARIVATARVQPDVDGDAMPEEAGRYGLVLSVFEREVTALDDPYLRETALDGPDTCLRTEVVWRVGAVAANSCKDFGPDWVPEPRPRARLAAAGVPAADEDDPCLTPDPGGYRGTENRLYRVEVHRGGEVGGGEVRVKWGRDNAGHRTRFTRTAERLTVASLGRDAVTALDRDQWVELVDEATWRAGRPGHMVRLGEVNGLEIAVAGIRDPLGDAPVVDGEGAPLVAALPAAGLLRRWEGGPPVVLEAETALPLERGIEVTASAGPLVVGDHWLIPARALRGNVEWPSDPATGARLAVPPVAALQAAMPLAIVEQDAARRLRVISDCRPLFAPLTEQIGFQVLGGDGQEAAPRLDGDAVETLVALPQPLRVGVVRGTTPVAGRRVRFVAIDATDPARLDPVPGTPAARVLVDQPGEVVVTTDAAGVAEVRARIDGRRRAYAVEARLLDAAEPGVADPEALPIRFFATASRADMVAYDPDNCPFQRRRAGEEVAARTVQEALDRLCPAIAFVPLGGDGQVAVPSTELAAPLRVGLRWGGRPLADVVIAFRVVAGDARLEAEAVATGEDGTAEVGVVAGSAAGSEDGVIRIEARAERLPQPSWPERLRFTARFVSSGGVEAPALRARALIADANGNALVAGETLSGQDLARGLTLVADGRIDPEVGRDGYAVDVVVDLPDARARGAGGTPFRLLGRLAVEGPRLRWRPTEPAVAWLGDLDTLLAELELARTSARFNAHGGAIASADAPRRWLAGGPAFLPASDTLVEVPGAGRPGGLFIFPFAVGRSARN